MVGIIAPVKSTFYFASNSQLCFTICWTETTWQHETSRVVLSLTLLKACVLWRIYLKWTTRKFKGPGKLYYLVGALLFRGITFPDITYPEYYLSGYYFSGLLLLRGIAFTGYCFSGVLLFRSFLYWWF